MHLGKQRRSTSRKARNYGAWITFDGDIRSYECHVLDVSAGGAKLIADIDALVGSHFRLSIAPNALTRKPCEIVWRRGRQIGVRFEDAVGGEPGFGSHVDARDGEHKDISARHDQPE